MTIGPEAFAFLQQFLKKRSGVVVDESKVYLVVARLLPVVRQHKLMSLDALADRLRLTSDAAIQRDVLNAMMTHETSFFRDKSPFETLKQLIPEMVKKRGVMRQLVLWSAASSTGQEAYSIAILINEHFRELLATWKIRIIATDISDVVLTRAREGIFNELEIVRGLPPSLLRKYFTPLQGKWSISQECRRLVEFRQLNLNDPWPVMPPCDIVFLRNVLLYFDVPTRRTILEKMRKIVRPDGGLFLGGAETMLGINESYSRLSGMGCSYYRPKP
ncbi:MAG: protein-glutamate O-methyltransferase CheR [Planctomycetota bacterium]